MAPARFRRRDQVNRQKLCAPWPIYAIVRPEARSDDPSHSERHADADLAGEAKPTPHAASVIEAADPRLLKPKLTSTAEALPSIQSSVA